MEERKSAGAIDAVRLQDEAEGAFDVALLLELALDHRAHLGDVLCCIQHWGSRQPERDIGHGRLAELVRRTCKVEHVVDDLISKPEVVAVLLGCARNLAVRTVSAGKGRAGSLVRWHL